MQIHIRAISVLRPSHKMAKSYYFFVVLKLKIRTGAYGDLASEIHTWGRILTNLYFECLELDLNCNQLGASAPQKSSLQPPTDYNFMVIGQDFNFFLITFECNVRF